jgi:hypothetical protein
MPTAPTFSRFAPSPAAVPATPFDALITLDSKLLALQDLPNFETLANIFSSQMLSALGSDAKFLPVGNLALREYPGLDREIPMWEVLHYLGVDLKDKAVCSFVLPDARVCATVHSVRTWPGYFLVMRSMRSARRDTEQDMLLSVFKLYKTATI